MRGGLAHTMRRAAWLGVYLALAAAGGLIGFQLSAHTRAPAPARVAAPAAPATPAIAPDPATPAPPAVRTAPGFAAPGPSFAQLVKELGPAVVHIQVKVGGGRRLFGVDEGLREG